MNKKIVIKYLIMFIISISIIVFVYNDYFLYDKSILHIDKIEESYVVDETTKEKYITQNITGTIKNGEYKGKKAKLINYTTTSGVFDEQIHKNSELFIDINGNLDNITNLNEVKRDKYLALLLVLFIDLIIIVAKKKSFKLLLSLFINIIVSYLSIIYFSKHTNTNMLLLYMIVSIIFITSSLFIANGKSKKTLAAILSSIASLFISFFLVYLVIKLYKHPISYWTLDYIEAVHDYKNFFYVTVLLSGLGAIMDISITIASSLSELIEKDPKIKLKALRKSGEEICKDIIGTMSNVMLYTCFTSIIPMTFLIIKNGITLGNAIVRYGEIELIVVLTSCISIVLAIPISLFISLKVLRGNKK